MALSVKQKAARDAALASEEPLVAPEEAPEMEAPPRPAAMAVRPKRRGAFGLFLQLLVGIVGLAALALPTFIVLMGGMVPTLVAILVDERPNRHRIQTIGAFNLTGVVVFLVPLWASGHTMHHAIRLMSDVYTWAVMYTAAAIGVGALWLGPQVAALVSNMMAVGRKRDLEAIRSTLLDEWGTDIMPEDEVLPKTAAKKKEMRDSSDAV